MNESTENMTAANLRAEVKEEAKVANRTTTTAEELEAIRLASIKREIAAKEAVTAAEAALRKAEELGADDAVLNELSGVITDAEEAADEVADREPWLRQKLATHPATSAATLLALSTDNAPEVARSVIYNDNAPVEALMIAMEASKARVDRLKAWNAELAPHGSCKSEIFIAEHDDFTLRSVIARHPNTPVEMLVEMTKDSDVRIRETVCCNLNTPIEALEELIEAEKARNVVQPAYSMVGSAQIFDRDDASSSEHVIDVAQQWLAERKRTA